MWEGGILRRRSYLSFEASLTGWVGFVPPLRGDKSYPTREGRRRIDPPRRGNPSDPTREGRVIIKIRASPVRIAPYLRSWSITSGSNTGGGPSALRTITIAGPLS